MKKGFQLEGLIRMVLCLYFLVFCYRVALGMFPLPDETPRMKFWEFAFALSSLVIGFQMLASRFRFFLLGVLFYLPLADWHLQQRAKFLEMMLEDFKFESALRFGLILVALLLMTPWALRAFSLRLAEYRSQPPLLFRKGLPY